MPWARSGAPFIGGAVKRVRPGSVGSGGEHGGGAVASRVNGGA